MTGTGRQGARFGRFGMVGILGAVLQVILVGRLIEWFHLPVFAATPIAVETVLLHNFLWHERFTWRDRKFAGLRQRAIRLARFHFGNGLVSIAGNTVMTYFLVQQLKAPALPSAVAAIAVCAPVNFWVADRWVYGSLPGKQPREIRPEFFEKIGPGLEHHPEIAGPHSLGHGAVPTRMPEHGQHRSGVDSTQPGNVENASARLVVSEKRTPQSVPGTVGGAAIPRRQIAGVLMQ